jgi:hypothetical protein
MRIFVFVLFFFIIFSLSAKTKLALLGTSKESRIIADLVLSENSENFAFLERQDIEVVLQEQKLSLSGFSSKDMLKVGELLNVDLFAIISPSSEDNMPANIIIFNAKNGFRLINSNLPNDIEKAVAKISIILEKAQKKINKENLVLLSFFTLRDADTPSHFHHKLKLFTISLERQLSIISDIVILEREYLDTSNTERILTGRTSKISPSAKLLRFEFSQGKTAKEINLILRISDSTNKVLFHINKQDCLTKQSVKTAEIIKEILPLLRASHSTSTNFSAKEEAARLFKEYKRLYRTREGHKRIRKHKEAYAKLFSAIALDPENFSFRLAALPYYPSYKKRTDEKYRKYVLQTANNLYRDFPQAKDLYRRVASIFAELRIDNSENTVTPDSKEQKTANSTIKELRIKHYKELDKKIPGWNWREGINSEREFEIYFKYLKMIDYRNYLDPEAFSDDITKMLEVELKYLIKKKYFHNQVSELKNPSTFFVFRCRTAPPEAIALVIKKSAKIIDILKKYNHKGAQRDGNMLELFKDYLNCNISKQGFFKKIKLIIEGRYKNINPYGSSDYKLFLLCRKVLPDTDKKLLGSFYRSILKFPRASTPTQLKFWKQFVAKCNKERDSRKVARMIIKNSDLISKHKKELEKFIKRKAGFYFSSYADYPNTKSMKVFLSALKKLSPKLDIKVLTSSKSLGKGSGIYKEKLFFGTKKGIFYFDLTTKIKFKLTSEFGEKFCFYKDKLIVSSFETNLSKNNSLTGKTTYFKPSIKRAISTRRGNKLSIKVISLNRTHSTSISDLPITHIKNLQVLNGRVYAFSSQGILFSCDLKGMNRKIEISPNREEKLNILDNKAKILQTMLIDPIRNCLIFGTVVNRHSHPDHGIWEYFPDTGKTNFIPHKGGSVWLVDIYPKNEERKNLKFLDLYKDAAKFIHESADKSSKSSYLLYYGKRYPYYCSSQVQPGMFWGPGMQEGNFYGKSLKYLDNGKIKEINLPFMHSVRRAKVYPHPDGKSFIVLYKRTIFQISRKTKDKH